VSITIAQDETERTNKAPKHYLGNGSVIWTDGKIVKGERDNDSKAGFATTTDTSKSYDDDLPF
jgi:hypothetical protein